MASGPPTYGIAGDGFLPLGTALALPADEPAGAAIAAMARHVATDLTREHPDLGRDGPVCPYAAGAARRDLVRIGASPLDRPDLPLLRQAIAGLRTVFERLAAETAPRDRVYCTAILVLPGLPSRAAPLVEQAQREAKPAFVRDGLMIGEFYPGCPKPGLHSPRFRPFDAPVAAFAVRTMTAYDTPFLAEHPDFMASYTRLFGIPRQPAGPRGPA